MDISKVLALACNLQVRGARASLHVLHDASAQQQDEVASWISVLEMSRYISLSSLS